MKEEIIDGRKKAMRGEATIWNEGRRWQGKKTYKEGISCHPCTGLGNHLEGRKKITMESRFIYMLVYKFCDKLFEAKFYVNRQSQQNQRSSVKPWFTSTTNRDTG